MSVRVCFVCLGNICRSPTAEGVFRDLVEKAGLDDHILIDSAGTAGYHAGEPADARSRQAAASRGVRIDSIARQFSRVDFRRFDYVLAMDRSNLHALQDLAGPERIPCTLALFRTYDPTAPAQAEVPDPYYGGRDGFQEVFDQCQAAAMGLLDHIRLERGL